MMMSDYNHGNALIEHLFIICQVLHMSFYVNASDLISREVRELPKMNYHKEEPGF